MIGCIFHHPHTHIELGFERYVHDHATDESGHNDPNGCWVRRPRRIVTSTPDCVNEDESRKHDLNNEEENYPGEGIRPELENWIEYFRFTFFFLFQFFIFLFVDSELLLVVYFVIIVCRLLK